MKNNTENKKMDVQDLLIHPLKAIYIGIYWMPGNVDSKMSKNRASHYHLMGVRH